jgi:hypothetical protein
MTSPVVTRSVFFVLGACLMAVLLSTLPEEARLASALPTHEGRTRVETAISAPSDNEVPATTSGSAALPPQKLLDAALPVLRACEGQERTARSLLLLSELRRAGPEGFAAMRELLVIDDLPFGPRFAIPHATFMGPRSLHAAVLNELSKSDDPEVRSLFLVDANRLLRSSETITDAYGAIQKLDRLEPGAHRADAIEALQRFTRDEQVASGMDTDLLWRLAAQFGAVELLPELEAIARQQSGKALPDLFGALWAMPATAREETTQRILSDTDLQPGIRSGYTLQKLDYRIPAAREFAVAWFRSPVNPTDKAEAVDRLASAFGWGPEALLRAKSGSPAGTPGTAPQATARLRLLDEIAPLCPEPLIQQRIAAARKILNEQASSTSK